jgi:hypothetical protein
MQLVLKRRILAARDRFGVVGDGCVPSPLAGEG